MTVARIARVGILVAAAALVGLVLGADVVPPAAAEAGNIYCLYDQPDQNGTQDRNHCRIRVCDIDHPCVCYRTPGLDCVGVRPRAAKETNADAVPATMDQLATAAVTPGCAVVPFAAYSSQVTSNNVWAVISRGYDAPTFAATCNSSCLCGTCALVGDFPLCVFGCFKCCTADEGEASCSCAISLAGVHPDCHCEKLPKPPALAHAGATGSSAPV